MLRRVRARRRRAEHRLVDVRKDQLALAAGVACVHDPVDVLALEQRLDQLQLLLRLRIAWDEPEPVGWDDREIGHPPLLPLLVVLLRLGELHEVADRPRDHVRVGFEEDRLVARRARLRLRLRSLDGLFSRFRFRLLPAALRLDVFELAALEGTVERGREIAADGRLLGDDKRFGHLKHHSEASSRCFERGRT
jgi:hypothetical protein